MEDGYTGDGQCATVMQAQSARMKGGNEQHGDGGRAHAALGYQHTSKYALRSLRWWAHARIKKEKPADGRSQTSFGDGARDMSAPAAHQRFHSADELTTVTSLVHQALTGWRICQARLDRQQWHRLGAGRGTA